VDNYLLTGSRGSLSGDVVYLFIKSIQVSVSNQINTVSGASTKDLLLDSSTPSVERHRFRRRANSTFYWNFAYHFV